MNEIHRNIVKSLRRLIDRILFFEKRSRFEHGKVVLYPSEMHLILMIHHGQATNATRIAEEMGVTKGAVSQTLTRLEKKGVLEKTKDPFNKNELTMSFTARGREILEKFKHVEEHFHRKHAEYLKHFSPEELQVIQRFLHHLETSFSDH